MCKHKIKMYTSQSISQTGFAYQIGWLSADLL